MDLTHIDEKGAARMVDVGGKPATRREATARATVEMRPQTLELILRDEIKKGDVLATARIAGIMAAKRTHEAIPLCHPIAITSVKVDIEPVGRDRLSIVATVACTSETGVEMEALHAASVAALTIYDMCKAVDKDMTIASVQLMEKSGGRSGHYVRAEQPTIKAFRLKVGAEVSLLDAQMQQTMKKRRDGLCAARFKADIITSNVDYAALGVGDRFQVMGHRFEVSREKDCYEQCAIRERGEDCALRRGAIFATVLETEDTGCLDD
jgi:cyclic pyranopterin phosphate synthase